MAKIAMLWLLSTPINASYSVCQSSIIVAMCTPCVRNEIQIVIEHIYRYFEREHDRSDWIHFQIFANIIRRVHMIHGPERRESDCPRFRLGTRAVSK